MGADKRSKPSRVWVVLGLIALLGIAGATAFVVIRAGTSERGGSSPPALQQTDAGAVRAVQKDREQNGIHHRLRTGRGPVHVWTPAGYRAASATTVVYVHGFGTPADVAWVRHRLAAQFAASRRNARFIVPTTRTHNDAPIVWQSLPALLATVDQMIGTREAQRRVVAVGHSGAFRTIAGWLSHTKLDRVVLLDGLYSATAEYSQWLSRANSRMIMIARNTSVLGEPFQKRHGAIVLDRIPENASGLDPGGTGKLIYIRSQYTHMGIVTSVRVIPVVLQWTNIESI